MRSCCLPLKLNARRCIIDRSPLVSVQEPVQFPWAQLRLDALKFVIVFRFITAKLRNSHYVPSALKKMMTNLYSTLVNASISSFLFPADEEPDMDEVFRVYGNSHRCVVHFYKGFHEDNVPQICLKIKDNWTKIKDNSRLVFREFF